MFERTNNNGRTENVCLIRDNVKSNNYTTVYILLTVYNDAQYRNIAIAIGLLLFRGPKISGLLRENFRVAQAPDM